MTFLKNYVLILVIHVMTIHVMHAQQWKLDSLKKEKTKIELKENFTERDADYIKILVEFGRFYRFINSDSIIRYAKEVDSLSEAADFTGGIADAYGLYGDYYTAIADKVKAIEYYDRAFHLEEVTDESNITSKLRFLKGAAYTYYSTGDYSNALIKHLEGKDLALAYDQKEILSNIYENIAILYSMYLEFDQSIEFYEKAVQLNTELGNELMAAQTSLNMTSTYIEMAEFEKGIHLLNKSIPILKKYELPDWTAFAYQVKGKLLKKSEQYEEALLWYHKSLEIQLKIEDPYVKVSSLLGVAEILLFMEEYDESFKYATECLALAEKIKAINTKKNILFVLYSIYKTKNESAKALSNFELYKTLSDSLMREENNRSLALLKASLKHEREKDAIRKESERKIDFQRNVIYFAVLLLLTLGTVTIFVKRKQNLEKLLNIQLSEKNKLIEERETQLKRSDQAKNNLISIIGHDLRGPVGSLHNLIEATSQKAIKMEELQAFLPTIQSNLNHLLFTLNNLLSWGRSQMQDASVTPKSISIASLLERNLRLLEEMAKGKSIEITSEVNSDAWVYADANQIDIVIRNLLSNALKFTPKEGHVNITSEEQEETWKISIKDSGVGMSEEMQKQLFSNEITISTYGTDKEKGTGLGLKLCREMIEQNQGSIGVNSKKGVGSTFYFLLKKPEIDS